ncbi:unnamed protein product [Menidia menidia]|uniref:(Atlantic silverside) hypothetical protein n=1 Tax=Menidia menidia TaxID=238744 RepID=A0A8S4BCR5_9TELE|nr:unnamed protein product [Menidia menidia]
MPFDEWKEILSGTIFFLQPLQEQAVKVIALFRHSRVQELFQVPKPSLQLPDDDRGDVPEVVLLQGRIPVLRTRCRGQQPEQLPPDPLQLLFALELLFDALFPEPGHQRQSQAFVMYPAHTNACGWLSHQFVRFHGRHGPDEAPKRSDSGCNESRPSLQCVRLRVANGDSVSMSTWVCSTVDSWGIWWGQETKV